MPERLYDIQEWLYLEGGARVMSVVTTVDRPMDVDQLNAAFLVPLAMKLAGPKPGAHDDDMPFDSLNMIPVYGENDLSLIPRDKVLYGRIVQVDRFSGQPVPVQGVAVGE